MAAIIARTRLSALVLGALGVALMTAWPASAQTAPPPVVAPSTPPAQKAPAAIAPLPTGTKIAFVNLQVVFNESELGKQGQARWRVLNEKLFANLSARNKEIEGLSEKLKTQQNVVGEAVLRTWTQDLARLQREAQFAQQEAQVQSDQLQQEVLNEFGKKVQPVIDALRTEKGLFAILGVQGETGGLTLLSAEPGMDLSAELVRRLNSMK